ncbi:TetR/AcrR family transcriptional regulator [Telmatospirillum sp. J64-1]|uniref:TetR/AcrR family transcriptional regulator n=1 Tax=Telmatospirillum sp. J64-1 TaxID=2502183 RepID=UPI001C8F6AA0|nr:TetR/AcrR family transcriptional regulator [Telmatospirillum sp. J64-1]
MDLFWRKGFDNTSIADLTDRLGLSPPSLYAAFGSKEQLFREALDLYAQTDGSGIWNHLETAPTAKEAVHRLLRATAERYTASNPARGCMIVLSAPQMEGGNTAICGELKARRQENVIQLEERLRQAVEEGELTPATDVAALASYFATVQQGMSIQARDGASRETLLAVADYAMAAWGTAP